MCVFICVCLSVCLSVCKTIHQHVNGCRPNLVGMGKGWPSRSDQILVSITGCLQHLEIYWNLKSLLEISCNLIAPGNFYIIDLWLFGCSPIIEKLASTVKFFFFCYLHLLGKQDHWSQVSATLPSSCQLKVSKAKWSLLGKQHVHKAVTV